MITDISLTLLTLSTTLNILMILGFIYAMRWRKAVGDNTLSIVPNELINLIANNKSKMEILLNEFKNIKKENTEPIKNTEKYLNILSESVAEKDKDINRLKEGYDTKIFKNFLNRFLRVYQIVEDDLRSYEENNKNNINNKVINLLSELKVDLTEAFLDCGLKEFSPKVGDSYRDAVGVQENPILVDTEKEKEDMKISEIKSKGFKTTGNEREEIIKPSIVSVYRYKKGA